MGAKADYDVLGVDISESMISLARRRVPDAEFRVASLFVDIPACNAITSLGECPNYLFDPDHDSQTLVQLFRRIYDALTRGGVFVFDIAEPDQLTQETITRGSLKEGIGWLLLEKEESRKRGTLTLQISESWPLGCSANTG